MNRYYNHPKLAFPIVRVGYAMDEFQNLKCTRYGVDNTEMSNWAETDLYVGIDSDHYAYTSVDTIWIGRNSRPPRPDGNTRSPSQMANACTLVPEESLK